MASQSRNQSRNRPKIAGTAFCLFCLSLFLTAYSARNPWTTQIGASFGSILMRPLQVLYYGGSSNVSDIWDGYFALVGVRKENERLKERMVTLEAENSKLIELESENKRLSDLLGVVKEIGVPGIAARVIGHDPSNWIQVLTVDIGEDRGIHTGMPVLADTGVVGQVVGVGRASARVLLLTDHSSGIDAGQ